MKIKSLNGVLVPVGNNAAGRPPFAGFAILRRKN
jgi:hypothetical protein